LTLVKCSNYKTYPKSLADGIFFWNTLAILRLLSHPGKTEWMAQRQGRRGLGAKVKVKKKRGKERPGKRLGYFFAFFALT
jgi:hypothetical protein